MPSTSNESYRKILDAGEVTANAVATLLVENLGNELDKNKLAKVIQQTKSLIKSKNNNLIDALQKLDA